MDFDTWFQSQKPFPLEGTEDMLPNSVWEDDGKYFAKCRMCNKTCELDFDLSDIAKKGQWDTFEHYCGSGPYCCP